MDESYPPFPPPPKHRRPFPSPPPPSNSDEEGNNYLISPSSDEEEEQERSVQPAVKRQIVDRYAQGFKFVPRGGGSRAGTGSGSNPGENVKIPADWSKDSTFALIRAWGDRFLMNGKGKLNSDHWAQIARDVNAVCERKYSVLQCQNRVETLKKMYKKQKAGAMEPSSSSSNWVYFEKMDSLMGERDPQLREIPPKFRTGIVNSGLQTGQYTNGEVPHDSESEEEEEEEDEEEDLKLGDNGGSRFRVLADSVKGIEEVFERLERKRKERVKELERMRAEFLNELETKQREIFERAQAEIAIIGENNDGNNDENDENNEENDEENDDDDLSD
ncbi:hypothetical protein LUZ60_000420 [Juncus effusus]|nr:hypothetical protein LUZ60_000420 [Juncus effusus]